MTPAAALTAAIAAEQVAAFGYGALGPRSEAGGQLDLARDCEQAHRQLAASATDLLARTSNAAPSMIAPPVYRLPIEPVDQTTARQLAVALEEAGASAWRYVLAQVSELARDETTTAIWNAAVSALTGAAVRAVRWRRLTEPSSASVAFPGV